MNAIQLHASWKAAGANQWSALAYGTSLRQLEVWFVAGSQHLYGPKTLRAAGANSQEGAGGLDSAALIDMGNRFRLLVNEVEVVAPDKPLPKLPVARAAWCTRTASTRRLGHRRANRSPPTALPKPTIGMARCRAHGSSRQRKLSGITKQTPATLSLRRSGSEIRCGIRRCWWQAMDLLPGARTSARRSTTPLSWK